MKKICAVNDKVVVKLLQVAREGMIHLPQATVQKTVFGQVISVGEKVKNRTIAPNRLVLLDNTVLAKYDSNIIVSEQDIIMALVNKTWYPLGRRLLLIRDISEVKLSSGIVIPECYQNTDQSLHCVFIRNGLINSEPVESFELVAGDLVRLAKWHKDIIEVDIEGTYHLIVKPSHLLYTTNSQDIENRVRV